MARKRMMAILAGITMTLGVAAGPALALESETVAGGDVTEVTSATVTSLASTTEDLTESPTEAPTGAIDDVLAEPAPGTDVDAPEAVEDAVAPESPEEPTDDAADPAGSTDPGSESRNVRTSSGSQPRVATTNAPPAATRTSTGQVAPQFRQQFAAGGTAAQSAGTQQDPGEPAPLVAPARPSEQPQRAPIELAAGLQTPRTPLHGPEGAGLRTLATMLTATAAAAWYLAREHGIA